MSAGIKIKGIHGITQALERLPKELMRSSETAVLRAGAKPILTAAKSNVPEGDSGLLKKSLGITVKKARGSTVRTARVGARTGFKGRKLYTKTIKKGKNAGQKKDVIQDPSFYDHLVEFGTSHSLSLIHI